MQRKVQLKKDKDERLAPGLDGVEVLNNNATPKEISEGDSTWVTKLKYDEYDPSET